MNTTVRERDLNWLGQAAPSVFVKQVGRLATKALIAEVLLSPKPGLVDQWDTGSHNDLSVELMIRSAECLHPFFVQMAAEGEHYRSCLDTPLTQPKHIAQLTRLREKIGQIGRDAEKQMLEATDGVNTHRGAIWALGLLVTSAGLSSSRISAVDLCSVAGLIASLPDQYVKQHWSKGQVMSQRYHVNGAREQAQNGFPAIIEFSLPALLKSRAQGNDEQHVQLDSLLSLMANLSDTCVLSRAGIDGLHFMQTSANKIIQAGGSATKQGFAQLIELNNQMIAINASPGGAADLLAATLLVEALESGTTITFAH